MSQTEHTAKPQAQNRRKLFSVLLVFFTILTLAAGSIYWVITSKRIYVEKSEISAPRIDLAPASSDTLQKTFVHEGDIVNRDSPVAVIGDEVIKTQTSGLIISVNKNIGANINPSQSVVSMIDPKELRIIGRVEENKGLEDLQVGQQAIFTVDAFGKKQYSGIVDEISPSSREGDIVFNISDKRETKEFDVKVRFSLLSYPELKNGMSAKLWIYK